MLLKGEKEKGMSPSCNSFHSMVIGHKEKVMKMLEAFPK